MVSLLVFTEMHQQPADQTLCFCVRLLHGAFLRWRGSDCETHQGQTLPESKKHFSPITPPLIRITNCDSHCLFFCVWKQKPRSEKSAVGSEGWEEGESEEEEEEDGGETEEAEKEKKEEEVEEKVTSEEKEGSVEEERKRNVEASSSQHQQTPAKKKTDDSKLSKSVLSLISSFLVRPGHRSSPKALISPE